MDVKYDKIDRNEFNSIRDKVDSKIKVLYVTNTRKNGYSTFCKISLDGERFSNMPNKKYDVFYVKQNNKSDFYAKLFRSKTTGVCNKIQSGLAMRNKFLVSKKNAIISAFIFIITINPILNFIENKIKKSDIVILGVSAFAVVFFILYTYIKLPNLSDIDDVEKHSKLLIKKRYKKKFLIFLYDSEENDKELIECILEMCEESSAILVLPDKYQQNEESTCDIRSSVLSNISFCDLTPDFIVELANSMKVNIDTQDATNLLKNWNYDIKKVVLNIKNNPIQISELEKSIVILIGVLNTEIKENIIEAFIDVIEQKQPFIDDLKSYIKQSKFIKLENSKYSLSLKGEKEFDEMKYLFKTKEAEALKNVLEFVQLRLEDFTLDELTRIYNLELAYDFNSRKDIVEKYAKEIVIRRINSNSHVEASIFEKVKDIDDDIFEKYKFLYYFAEKDYKLAASSLEKLHILDEDKKNLLNVIVFNRSHLYKKSLEYVERICIKNLSDNNKSLYTIYQLSNYLNLGEKDLLINHYMKNKKEISRLFLPLYIRVVGSAFNSEESLIIFKDNLYSIEKNNIYSNYEKALYFADFARRLADNKEFEDASMYYENAHKTLSFYSYSSLFILNVNRSIMYLLKGDYSTALDISNKLKDIECSDLQKLAIRMIKFTSKMLNDSKSVTIEELQSIEMNFVDSTNHDRTKQQFYINALFIHKYITGELSQEYLEKCQRYPDRDGVEITNVYIENIKQMNSSKIIDLSHYYKPIYLAHWHSDSEHVRDLVF